MLYYSHYHINIFLSHKTFSMLQTLGILQTSWDVANLMVYFTNLLVCCKPLIVLVYHKSSGTVQTNWFVAQTSKYFTNHKPLGISQIFKVQYCKLIDLSHKPLGISQIFLYIAFQLICHTVLLVWHKPLDLLQTFC